jgi:ribosome recycling factor
MIKLELNEQLNAKQFEKIAETAMEEHLRHYEKELLKIRTGRAHPTLIEDIRVSYHGSLMPLKNVASITAPDVQMLIVQPWDLELMGEIEKALATAPLGLTPNNDGTIIRIQLPRMTSARRDELLKLIGKKAEEARIAVRTVRKDIHNMLRDGEKSKKISEDLSRRLQDALQKATDKIVASVDTITNKKEEELKLL